MEPTPALTSSYGVIGDDKSSPQPSSPPQSPVIRPQPVDDPSIPEPKLVAKHPTFSEDLWDAFEVLKDRTELGLENCKEVLEFFKRLSAVEDEYIKNLSKVVQKFQPRHETGSISTGWTALSSLLESNANFHRNLLNNMTNNLSHPMQVFTRDMEARKKNLIASSTKLRADLKENTEAVKRSQAKYEKAAREHEIAKNEYIDAKPVEQEAALLRLEKKSQKAEVDAAAAEAQHRAQIDTTNSFIESYQSSKMPGILEDFEQFEITRMQFLKSSIYNFLGLVKEIPGALDIEVTNSMKACDTIAIDEDLQQFIKQHRVTKQIIKPFVFEPYLEAGRRAKPGLWDQLKSNLGPSLINPLANTSATKLEVTTPRAGSTAIFGVPLVEIVQRQQNKLPGFTISGFQIPKILEVLTEGILCMNGLNTEGIFRVAASHSELKNLKRQLDNENYGIVSSDVHVLANLLKQFIRELPEPLIPTENYDDCVNNIQQAAAIIDKINPVHKNTLIYIIQFLQVFFREEFVSNNKMDVANMATVFAPAIMRCPYSDTSALANATLERHFLEILFKQTPRADVSLFPSLATFLLAAPPRPNLGSSSEKDFILEKPKSRRSSQAVSVSTGADGGSPRPVISSLDDSTGSYTL